MTAAGAVFWALALFALTPWASPPLALALGIAFGLLAAHPYPAQVKKATKLLLQTSVVGLGFGMNLHQVLKAGANGFLYTAGGIAIALAAGTLIGRALGVGSTISRLISTGTAICGGSAIAALGPVLGADAEEMSVSLATVFLLNSIALLTFPQIGAALGLSQEQFGLWAALAIHDTSSVVGACVKYGPAALAVGATVKLARALWIIPLTLGAAAIRKSDAEMQWPWFILFFVLAAAARSLAPGGENAFLALTRAAKAGLSATLFLIGTGISLSALRKIGARPLVQGAALWLLVGAASLALIRAGVVR